MCLRDLCSFWSFLTIIEILFYYCVKEAVNTVAWGIFQCCGSLCGKGGNPSGKRYIVFS